MPWEITNEIMRFRSTSSVVFEDNSDHFLNGFCRLLGLDVETGCRLVEVALADLSPDDLAGGAIIPSLQRAVTTILGGVPAGPAVAIETALSAYGHRADWLVAPGIGESASVAVIGNRAAEIAWLVDHGTLKPLQMPVIAYDESYFDGKIAGVGYGDYLVQQGWRVEKGHRLVRRIAQTAAFRGIRLPARPRLLDIGSGYGFFRKAAGDAGWEHDGWEVSAHAGNAARGLFGFNTDIGTLESLAADSRGGYDLITMWDVIEHVPDPLKTLRLVHGLLAPGGAVFLRTPNIMALESEIFGWRYHSLKLEHLFYFGPRSLVRLLEDAGFALAHLATDSHLLSGFLGRRQSGYESLLRGSDFFACALRHDA